jgi:hypothetical protein
VDSASGNVSLEKVQYLFFVSFFFMKHFYQLVFYNISH